jgi:alkanesulfonate monooxygenase SsuD/methylene tetrahydromethanopterin reductase-like flavin-dependent oxidoreductase (luciferase family)
VKLGYFSLFDNLPIFGAQRLDPAAMLRDLAEEAVACDQLGFSSFWVAEHHGPHFGQLPSPAAYLGYLAAKTRRITLGPACVILPINHPVRVAEEYAVLDQLSGGRIALAVGRGNEAKDYTLFGADYGQSRDLLREGADLIRRIWSEPGLTYHGNHYRIDAPLTLNQYPVLFSSGGRPSIAIAAYSPPTVMMAAELGLDLMLSPLGVGMAFSGLDRAVAAFREAADRAGHPDLKVTCSYDCAIGDSAAEIEQHKTRFLRYMHGLLEIAGGRPDNQTATPLVAARQRVFQMKPGDVGPDLLLTGDAETIATTLRWCESLGIDEVILDVNFGCYPHRDTMAQLERLAGEVLPAFAAMPA